MKVIIPLAGKGTRLRPHTHVTPKPMLRIAGKPVMDYVMDDVKRLGGVEQVVYITGHLKEKVEEHARRDIGLPSRLRCGRGTRLLGRRRCGRRPWTSCGRRMTTGGGRRRW